MEAEKIPNSKKLLKVKVDIGTERPVVAGISTSYTTEEVIGHQVIVVANLKPVKLMGVQSQGMILAASDKKMLTLASFCKNVEPGMAVK